MGSEVAGVSDELVEKVVALITRGEGREQQLVVFRHALSGPQLPAGTVERGEPVGSALLREVSEETGLTEVRVVRKLALLDERLPPDDLMVTEHAVPVCEPRAEGAPVPGRVRRGMGFTCWEERDGYARIAYRTGDMGAVGAEDAAAVQAWIPLRSASRRIRRHVYHLVPSSPTPDHWLVRDAEADLALDFSVYWTPLWGDIGLHPVQDGWLRAGRGVLQASGNPVGSCHEPESVLD